MSGCAGAIIVSIVNREPMFFVIARSERSERRGNPLKHAAFTTGLRERAEAQSENHSFRDAVFRESSKTISESVQRHR